MVEDRQRGNYESNVALAVAVSCPTYPPVDCRGSALEPSACKNDGEKVSRKMPDLYFYGLFI